MLDILQDVHSPQGKNATGRLRNRMIINELSDRPLWQEEQVSGVDFQHCLSDFLAEREEHAQENEHLAIYQAFELPEKEVSSRYES